MTRRYDTAEIRRYYDRHTPAFLRFGQGGGAIHRAVWFTQEATTDLSSALEIGRTRDRAIDLLGTMFGWMRIGRIDYLVGGSALQTCLARGWVGCDFVVFRRAG